MNRFVLSRLVSFPSHGALSHPTIAIAVSLAPNRSRVSSLLPPARANHVLFSRSPPSGMRPLLPCATRAARVLRTKSRHSSRFSLVSFSPLQRSTPRALVHPLVTLLSLVAYGRRRPCCAPIARSRLRSSCVLQLVLRVRHVKHAPPPFFLQLALSPISLSARRRLATSIAFSILVLVVSCPFFPSSLYTL